MSNTISQFLIAKLGFKHKIVMGKDMSVYWDTFDPINKLIFLIHKFECTLAFVLHKSLTNSSKTSSWKVKFLASCKFQRNHFDRFLSGWAYTWLNLTESTKFKRHACAWSKTNTAVLLLDSFVMLITTVLQKDRFSVLLMVKNDSCNWPFVRFRML